MSMPCSSLYWRQYISGIFIENGNNIMPRSEIKSIVIFYINEAKAQNERK